MVDDFFDPQNHEIAPADFKSYDIMQNAKNQEFLKSVFRNPPSILPIQNLGEIAFILQKPKESFALLDMSLKTYGHLDP